MERPRVNRLLDQINPRLIVILCAVLVVVMTATFITQGYYIRSQDRTIEGLIGEYGTLKSQSIDLEEKIAYSYTDAYIEREARSKLGLIREGETLFQSSGIGDGE